MPAGARVILRRTISRQQRGMTNLRGVSALTGGHQWGGPAGGANGHCLSASIESGRQKSSVTVTLRRGKSWIAKVFSRNYPSTVPSMCTSRNYGTSAGCESADEKVLDGGVSDLRTGHNRILGGPASSFSHSGRWTQNSAHRPTHFPAHRVERNLIINLDTGISFW
jgi:hypothetical protein